MFSRLRFLALSSTACASVIACTQDEPFRQECPAGQTPLGDGCVRDVEGGGAGAVGGAGTGGAAGSSPSAGAGGTGGAKPCACPASRPYCTAGGECVECVQADQCSLPNGQCLVAECSSGTCTAKPVKAGVATSKQKPNDCTSVVCNGNGGEALVIDTADTPTDDGNPCTEEACDGEKPSHPFSKAGAPCGAGVCNGKGTCGVCVPGDVRCFDNKPQSCSSSGTWIDGNPCSSPDPVCSKGKCTHPTSITAGGLSACAILADQTVRCWGDNSLGQLGPGAAGDDVIRPQLLAIPPPQLISISAAHACAVLKDETVQCWGANDHGQLGDGTHTSSATPVTVPGLKANAVAATLTHTCASKGGEAARCWGQNQFGELGIGSTGPDVPTPATVGGSLPNFIATGSGSADWMHPGFTCEIIQSGLFGMVGVKCWGDNSSGQLGTGNFDALSSPGPAVPGSYSLGSGLALGDAFACLRTSATGAMFCWGDNKHGQLGTGAVSEPSATKPVQPVGLEEGATAFAVGGTFACAVKNAATLCWGSNTSGELATGKNGGPGGMEASPVPTLVKNAVSLALGDSFGCALLADNRVQCWGANGVGSLGDGTKADRPFPADVAW